MQKQLLALFSSPLLLTPKSYPLHSRLLHTQITRLSRPIDRLKSWNLVHQTSEERCRGSVVGFCQKRQIRGESTIAMTASTEKEKQRKAPWHREGSDVPPVARQRSAGAMVKGKWITVRASTLADERHRKAIDNTVSPAQTHHTSHNS